MPTETPITEAAIAADHGALPISPRRRLARSALWALLLALVPLFYALFVIRDFSGPIGDHSESFISEYLGWYTAKHLDFWPFPKINLVTDEVLYPFGTNVALQSFCVERDLLMAALTNWAGRGPWLQLYYLGGVACSVVIAFLLLRRDHGGPRAAAATVLMHLFNFYSMQKYPYHYNIAVCHWTVAGMVCDFVLVERALAGKTVSLRLVLFRALLVVLAFGLELGHVLGYSLTSALLAAGLLLFVHARRWRRERATWSQVKTEIGRVLAAWRDEAKAAPGIALLLVLPSAFFAWLYGSVVYSIVAMTRQYDFSGLPVGSWFSNPLRLLIPYFPFLHPSQQPRFLHVLGDSAEQGIGSGGAGWLLLALAVLGVRQAWREARLLPYAPLLAAFIAYALSHPSLPFMRLLPWFTFMRVFSRATLVYSTLFALFAIDLSLRRSFPSLSTSRRRAALAGLAVLAVVELSTLVMIKRGDPAYAPGADTSAYFERIRREPGEALLDWPFCLLGGNGDIGGLCPYWSKLRGVFALQRFHEKKVVGHYLGRLHPQQISPFLDAGWDRLFQPDDNDISVAGHQTRCFVPDEWRLFTEFFQYNDFAGIQLAADRLAPGCEDEFYRRFGPPAAETRLAAAGRMVFIPKPAAVRALADPEKGRRVRLVDGELEPTELIGLGRPTHLIVTGLSHVEPDIASGRAFRWSLGPATRILFNTGAPREIALGLRAWSELGGQAVTVVVDGETLATWDGLPEQESFERALQFKVGPGAHVLELRYRRWNGHPGDTWTTADRRQMALRLYSLHLEPR